MARFFTTDPIAFHDDALGPVPAGAQSLSDAAHGALLAGQAEGRPIVATGNTLALAEPLPVAEPLLASQARAALDASDVTAIRCVKAGVAFPAEWQAYCTALRSIVAGALAQALPPRPDYPAGT